ncbi:MAG: OB-fold nucleic acid binding domain-containing protein [Candidatus Woesearchaeota archaeon]
MKIKDLQPKQSGVTLECEITEKGDIREFSKFGKAGRVCNAVVKDDSGKVKLTLWNEDIDKVKVGDKIKLENGYVNEYQGEMQLTTGRLGKFTVLDSKPSQPKAEEESDELKMDEHDEDSSDDVDEEFIQ